MDIFTDATYCIFASGAKKILIFIFIMGGHLLAESLGLSPTDPKPPGRLVHQSTSMAPS